jgi:hypothetical protein
VIAERFALTDAANGDEGNGARRPLASNRCSLGLLYAKTGWVEAARRELSEARALGAGCNLGKELGHLLCGPACEPSADLKTAHFLAA